MIEEQARGRGEDETRLYIVVRDDIRHGREGLMALSFRGVWTAMTAAIRSAPGRVEAYDAAVQPKIAVRVRSEGHLRRCLEESIAAGLPAVMVEAAEGIPGAVVVGPARRSELPPFVAKQRLLDDAEREDATPLPAIGTTDPQDIPPDALVAVVAERRNARIPWGKLAAQSGHAAYAMLVSSMGMSDRARESEWTEEGMLLVCTSVPDQESFDGVFQGATGHARARIVDAGRTVYEGRPTPTIVGVGPLEARDIPPELRDWMRRSAVLTVAPGRAAGLERAAGGGSALEP